MSTGYPFLIGSVNHQSPLQLAERAIAIAGDRSKSGKKKFGVTLDISGRVHLDRAEPAGFHGVYLGTIDRRSDPDWLADEISAEASSRDKPGSAQVVAVRILGIDPGTTESGWCKYYNGFVTGSGVLSNAEMIRHVQDAGSGGWCDALAIEMVASYGMAVGKETFRTVWWSGRFTQAWRSPDSVIEVYRADVKMHLCHSMKAKDANIRQALIDMYGGKEAAIGKKANPGPLYGVSSHAWAALAVAVTAGARLKQAIAA